MLMNVNAIMVHAEIPLSAQSSIYKLQSNSTATVPPEWNNIHLHDFKEFVEIPTEHHPLVKCRNSDIETKYGHQMRRPSTWKERQSGGALVAQAPDWWCRSRLLRSGVRCARSASESVWVGALFRSS